MVWTTIGRLQKRESEKKYTTLVCDSDFQPKVLQSADRSLHVGRIGFRSSYLFFFFTVSDWHSHIHTTKTENEKWEKEH